jgi:hypothetical protein
MLWRTLKFFAGLLAGIALWWEATPFYNCLLGSVAQPLLHLDPRFSHAALETLERMIRVTSAQALPVANIPADLLTYNVILLLALFATNDRPWRIANLRAVAISLAIVFVAHVVGLLISIESTYALRLGEWSAAHYGDIAQDIWLALELFYRIVGMFGVAFGCWWATSRR